MFTACFDSDDHGEVERCLTQVEQRPIPPELSIVSPERRPLRGANHSRDRESGFDYHSVKPTQFETKIETYAASPFGCNQDSTYNCRQIEGAGLNSRFGELCRCRGSQQAIAG